MNSKIESSNLMNATQLANVLVRNEGDKGLIEAQVKGLIALIHSGRLQPAVKYATAVFSALYSDSAAGFSGTLPQLRKRQKNARKSLIRRVNTALKSVHGSEMDIVLNGQPFNVRGKALRHLLVSTTGNQHKRRIKISFPIVKPMDETGDTSATATNGENTPHGEPTSGGGNATTTAAGQDTSNKSEHDRMLALSQSPDALEAFVKHLDGDMFKRLVGAVEHRQALEKKASEQSSEQANALEQAQKLAPADPAAAH